MPRRVSSFLLAALLAGCASQPQTVTVTVPKPYYIMPPPVNCPTLTPPPPYLGDYQVVILPPLKALGLTPDKLADLSKSLGSDMSYLSKWLDNWWVALSNAGQWQTVDENDKQKLSVVQGLWAAIRNKDQCIKNYNDALQQMKPPEIKAAPVVQPAKKPWWKLF